MRDVEMKGIANMHCMESQNDLVECGVPLFGTAAVRTGHAVEYAPTDEVRLASTFETVSPLTIAVDQLLGLELDG